MRKPFFILLLALCVSITGAAQENTARAIDRIRFSCEWGYVQTIYHDYHFNILSEEGYRINESFYGFSPHPNGLLLLGVHQTKNTSSVYRQARRERDEKTARALAYTCFMVSNSTTSGLPPEGCTLSDVNGMVIQNQKYYALRPEIIESFFFLKETQEDPIAQ